jgi:hypothetical protein
LEDVVLEDVVLADVVTAAVVTAEVEQRPSLRVVPAGPPAPAARIP